MQTPNTLRWGILYCPQEGSCRSRRRWARIQARLQVAKQPYDFVQSEGPGQHRTPGGDDGGQRLSLDCGGGR